MTFFKKIKGHPYLLTVNYVHPWNTYWLLLIH